MTNLVAKENQPIIEFTVDLRDLYKLFGYKSVRPLNRKLETFAKSLNNKTCQIDTLMKSYTYKTTSTKKGYAKSYLLTENFARSFVMVIDPAKGFEYVQSLENKIQQQAIQIQKQSAPLEQEVKHLESKIATSQKQIDQRAQRDIPNPRAKAIKEKHELLQEWVKNGWLESSKIITTRWKYKITEKGSHYLCKVKSHIERI